MGRALLDLECYNNFIKPSVVQTEFERLTRSTLPVLITGDYGTEKIHNCYQYHIACHKDDVPFVVVNPEEFQGVDGKSLIALALSKVEGGTLVFKNIDAFSEGQHKEIKRLWLSVRVSNGRAMPRLMATFQSSTSNTENTAAIAKWFDFHSLVFVTSSLTERRHDIPDLVKDLFVRLGRPIAASLTPGALSILEAYHWPGNVKQLSRVLEKLHFHYSGKSITASILLYHFPSLQADTRDKTHLASVNSTVIERRPESVAKAVAFIQTNFDKPIKMADVASIACVSEAHLSYLLKRHVKKTFKELLIGCRIQKAAELLSAVTTRRVTDICGDVGFADLSNFTRTFKEHLGVSPGRFKKSKQAVDVTLAL